jgi:uracil-DNA glycosylase
MGIGEHLDTWDGWQAAVQALAWQADLGVTDPVGDTPLNRYDLPAEPPRLAMAAPPTTQLPPPTAVPPVGNDAVAVATALAEGALTLDDLRDALAAYDHCELKRGARSLVFADGNPAAHVLILGEAPGRDEDREGRPFVGRAGQLLDQMFAAIGLSRTSADPARAIYITNVLPWRPPENRDPTSQEIAMLRPFVLRHIALADPDVIVVMGNTPLSCLFGEKGIMRARGAWRETLGKPVMPMTHPAYLLRNPEAKREAWADLLAVQERLRG